jgi:Pectate lyase superfamily protein
MLVSRRNIFQTTVATGVSAIGPQQLGAATNPTQAQGALPVVSIKAFGALGDGASDDTAAIQAAVNECFGEATSPHSSAKAFLNKPLYFPPGIYMTSAPILLTDVRGAHIFGAGRHVTTIKNAAGTSVFRTNGFEYSRFEMMMLLSPGKMADVFDLDWTNSGGTALQSNMFADMSFEGGAIGVNIGKSDFMGSENLFLNCFFARCAVAGIKTSNFNALQNTLVGGNMQACAKGVWVSAGGCSVYNTGFQLGSDFDIVVNNSANDTMVISGSRSESVNFVQLRNGITAHISGCAHLNNRSNGIFADIAGGSRVSIDSCVSLLGAVTGNGKIKISNSSFGRSDSIDTSSIWEGFNEVENCYFGGTPNTGAAQAKFIARKRFTSIGAEWTPSRRSIGIGRGSQRMTSPIVAGTRIHRISLVIDKPGSGSIRVGDGVDAGRYFFDASLAGSTMVSPSIENKYDSDDSLRIMWVGATDVVAHIAVDFVVES